MQHLRYLRAITVPIIKCKNKIKNKKIKRKFKSDKNMIVECTGK